MRYSNYAKLQSGYNNFPLISLTALQISPKTSVFMLISCSGCIKATSSTLWASNLDPKRHHLSVKFYHEHLSVHCVQQAFARNLPSQDRRWEPSRNLGFRLATLAIRIGNNWRDLIRKLFCSASGSISYPEAHWEGDWLASTCPRCHWPPGNAVIKVGLLAH